MSDKLAKADTHAAAIERVLIQGDLARLTEQERISYYGRVCESLGLNPLTRPFQYLELGHGTEKKLVLYATKDCAEQMRKLHGISLSIVGAGAEGDVYVVRVRATTPDGRSDESSGAVPLVKEDGTWETSSGGKRYFKKNGKVLPLGPEELANAFLKCETKAKRRATLSVCGLGMLDETEVETIADARPVEEPTPQRHPEPKALPEARPAAHADPEPEPAPAKKPAKAPPANGAELYAALCEYDAELSEKGLCHMGDLIGHVRRAGVKAGHSDDIEQWSGAAVALAREATAAFRNSLPDRAKPAPAAPPPPPAPSAARPVQRTLDDAARPPAPATPEQLAAVHDLLPVVLAKQKGDHRAVRDKWLATYDVTDVADLSRDSAEMFLRFLRAKHGTAEQEDLLALSKLLHDKDVPQSDVESELEALGVSSLAALTAQQCRDWTARLTAGPPKEAKRHKAHA